MYSHGTLFSLRWRMLASIWCGKGEPPNGIASCWLSRGRTILIQQFLGEFLKWKMFAPRNPPMCKVNDKYFLRVIGESENNVSASESNAEQLSLFFFLPLCKIHLPSIQMGRSWFLGEVRWRYADIINNQRESNLNFLPKAFLYTELCCNAQINVEIA